MHKYDVSCGKGRRGCCIIIPDSDSGHVGHVIILSGPSVGGSPSGQTILVINPEIAGKPCKTDR
jgi:hypothetical protein